MIYEILDKIRTTKPLVHHITNWVTIYDCANITRMFGGLPVMAHAIEESADMANIASSLVLNIGTLTPELIESMKEAGKAANRKGIPIVLDAVGVGSTRLRNEKAFELISEIKIDVLKGNSSEIAKLAGEDVTTKGVEAISIDANPIEVAKRVAIRYNLIAVITGEEDIVTDGNEVYIIRNGVPMMGSVVGTGCMVGSVIGTFCAVEKNLSKASAYALACFGIAGEVAGKKDGPGSFKTSFFDAAYNLNQRQIKELSKIEIR